MRRSKYFIWIFVLVCPAVWAQAMPLSSNPKYTPFTKEEFEIYKKNPMSVDEIRAIIQIYDDTMVADYIPFAYSKMKKLSPPSPDQDKKLQPYLTGPKTRQAMFEFMLLMTREQIEVVGI